jgi:hypothetical protein
MQVAAGQITAHGVGAQLMTIVRLVVCRSRAWLTVQAPL